MSGRKRMLPDLSGRRFGRLLVVRELSERNPNGMIVFECKCDCGKITNVVGYLLLSGHTTSCGCFKKDKCTKYHTPEERALSEKFHTMDQRCNNPNHTHYKDYGGRGIYIDESLNTREKFIAWGLSNGFKLGLEIDRCDNNGPYSSSNCRFVGRREQQNNRRCTHNVTANGMTASLAEWERILGERPGFLADYGRNYGVKKMEAYIEDYSFEPLFGESRGSDHRIEPVPRRTRNKGNNHGNQRHVY